MLFQSLLGIAYGTLFGLYLGFKELLYVGWALLIIGFLFFLLGPLELKKKGGAPKGASCVFTTVLVESGAYSIVRHPQGLGFILIMIAAILASQHWLNLILGSQTWSPVL